MRGTLVMGAWNFLILSKLCEVDCYSAVPNSIISPSSEHLCLIFSFSHLNVAIKFLGSNLKAYNTNELSVMIPNLEKFYWSYKGW